MHQDVPASGGVPVDGGGCGTRGHRPPASPLVAVLTATVLFLTGCGGWGDVLGSSSPGTAGKDGCASPSPSATGGRLRLPRPTGPYPVGESTVELTDPARADPLAGDGRRRSLPVQVWYPAEPHGEPVAPYASAAVLALAEKHLHLCPGQLRADLAARHGPAVRTPPAGGWPVLVHSFGTSSFRMLSTSLVQSLASLGYVVLVVDHPFESIVTEYPDGRTVRAPGGPAPTGERAGRQFDTRVDDLRFVLDRLGPLDAGKPASTVRGALDTDRVGMLGHGRGGAATVHVMLADPRVLAGANLDGDNPGPAPDTELDRPLLTVGSADGGPPDDPGWRTLWPNLSGRHRELTVRGTGHLSFTDAAILAERWDVRRTWPGGQLGTIPGRRAVQITVTYLAAFFDQALGGRPSSLLEHEDPTHPEVTFDG